VLVQNTSWRNAARAIESLRAENLLDLSAIHKTPLPRLEALLRSSGYYRVKARRVYSMSQLVVEQFSGDLNRLWQLPTSTLRATLLAVHGIGPETADCMMLYAARRPIFVIDKYTWRMLVRHAWIGRTTRYDQMQKFFQRRLPADAAQFGEFHALLVRLGNDRCGARPRCDGCPLESLLPGGGPCAT
jgi:endonuclease-3 related protein